MRIIVILILQLAALLGATAAEQPLQQSFTSPPAGSRPFVYWYWMGGCITRDGITADLEALYRAGIGGVVIFNIGNQWGRTGPVKVLSPEWRDLMRHAIREAARLGIEVNLNNSMAGWSSSGGPWISPDLAMQKVTWSETVVQGGTSAVLPQPPTNLNTYRDIAVIAFPTPEVEKAIDPAPAFTSSDPTFNPARFQKTDEPLDLNWDSPSNPNGADLAETDGKHERFVQMQYPSPFAAHSLHMAFVGAGVTGTLQASDDAIGWRSVGIYTPRDHASVDLGFNSTPARYWRVLLSSRGVARISRLHLSTRYRITEWTAKAMFDSFGVDKPSFTDSADSPPPACTVRSDQIIDLTAKLDPTGRLAWKAPKGSWTILRFGYTPTGSRVQPADADGGLECDKLNAAALDVHFANSVQPWLDDKELNPLIRYIHIDSYERGAQNWTAQLPDQFHRRKQYDLRLHLPVLTGRVVDNVQDSERFLWDYRNVITSLMTENYFGHMHELCQKAGKRFTLEPYHQTQFDDIGAGGQADIPSTECWMGAGIPGPYWMKLGASPAHVYGRQLVQAESFTAPAAYGGKWNTDFWDMKPLGDAMFCGGVNHMVLHVFVHQPWSEYLPGVTLGEIGTHFDRTNTWWDQMPAFTQYISRCQSVLQRGTFVADVLYSCGENSPNESMDPRGLIALPPGYDYDVCDPYSLFERPTVRNGSLVLPEGISYRILVLPDDTAMTPAMAARIGALVKAGATVVAKKPTHSPSLADQPRADQQVRQLAETIWGDCDGSKATEHSYGKGRIFWGKPLSQILDASGIAPDVKIAPPFRYTHRRLVQGDLYFLASSSSESRTMDVAFRTVDGSPQLWDPVTGETRCLPQFRRGERQTVIPLQFAPRQSYFIFFDKSGTETKAGKPNNFSVFQPLMQLNGPWSVSFDPKWGGPSQVNFDKLEDWTKRPEPGIKYYSGKATYRLCFDLPAQDLRRKVYLDLGRIKNVAEVRLNGRNMGIVWCAPWRLAIGSALKTAGNQLEIDVVNLWANRMIGDEQLPDDCQWSGGLLQRWPDWFLNHKPRTSGRFTFAAYKAWSKDSPLFESGLLGPVTLQAAN